jgi:diguanylate cyclase (GGDEF)-like protein
MGFSSQTLVYGTSLISLVICAAVLVFKRNRRVWRLERQLAERDLALGNANERLSQAKSQLAQLSNKDLVTHLLARHVVVERFQLLRTQARRYGATFGIGLISFTDFGQLSDRLGKEAGKRLLASLGSQLMAMTRESDTVGFMRDHDFAVLMPNVRRVMGLDGAVSKLRVALRVPFILSGVVRPILPEVHFGKALYPNDGDDWTSILKAADNDLLLRRSRPLAERPDMPAQLREQGAARQDRPDAYEVSIQLWEPVATLGLGWPVTLETTSAWYKELAKRDHPDANGGSRDAEERQKGSERCLCGDPFGSGTAAFGAIGRRANPGTTGPLDWLFRAGP